jgi:hypothetical protein
MFLRLPSAGFRSPNKGTLHGSTLTRMYYWTRTTSGDRSRAWYAALNDAEFNSYSRAMGASVRCIKL